ncbi:MAG: PTS sugar transporter subunit IIC [Lachnospiraceae bacterium]|nr:PTS sugar transporter subunit IIC [Lachnospiraceae bacterium]
MKKFKEILKEIFIDGLGGMATGLFATLIVGTIVAQIGTWISAIKDPNVAFVGSMIILIGKIAQSITGAGIGIGAAVKLKSKPLVMVSAAASGMIGAFASKMIAGSVLNEGVIVYAGPGEPLGAFIAAMVTIYIGRLIADKTKLDILLTPLCCIASGALAGLLLGKPIATMMSAISNFIVYSTNQAPFIMGVLISVVMGMALTLPISSAAIGVILSLSGIPAGAATVGCCANMVGFAVASFEDNKVNGLVAQGIGTSMLQMPNIVKKPIIWLPAIITSAILGPLSTMVFKFQNNATGSGMGTAGLVGPINAYSTMTGAEVGMAPWLALLEIALLCFILPGVLSFLIGFIMRKAGLIKPGDMKLEK